MLFGCFFYEQAAEIFLRSLEDNARSHQQSLQDCPNINMMGVSVENVVGQLKPNQMFRT